ncbi:MAG: DUF4382 domain-containing protein [Gammaproteobacteria bacterium]|nr:DUF4382 domain-containing protein [Gammaproteobacteria bacterium]
MKRCVRHWNWAVVLATAISVAGCNGGSERLRGTPTGTATTMGRVQLSVADAPIDGASHVVVEFTGVELRPDAGNPITIRFAQPKRVDLLTQSGTASAMLVDQPIPAGTYAQLRLLVSADGSGNDSYVQLADGTMHGLLVPSEARTGLKFVPGFTVPTSGVVDYTIDFNLRQAITCPPGRGTACLLKPVERLVADLVVGNIQGRITSALPTACTPGVCRYDGEVARPRDMNDAAASADPSQPIGSTVPVATTTVAVAETQAVNVALGSLQGEATLPSSCNLANAAVYLYSGDVGEPEDWNTSAPSTDANQPVASMSWPPGASAPFDFAFTGLPPGAYTLAFTCEANLDNPAQSDPGVQFAPIKSALTVGSDPSTRVNLP